MEYRVCVGNDALERSVTGYYSELSDDEAKELELWGDLALNEFPHEDRAPNR